MSVKRKLVFVELNFEDSKFDYEVDYDIYKDISVKIEIESIFNVLKSKNSALNSYSCSQFLFTKPSERRPSKWVAVGDCSPIKELCEFQCSLIQGRIMKPTEISEKSCVSNKTRLLDLNDNAANVADLNQLSSIQQGINSSYSHSS